MKAFHKQAIDHLLRNIGAREEEFAGEKALREHLDPDEQNSYAEGVLPEATKARFTAHLADCRQCRRLTTELTASARVRVSEKKAANKVSSSFWEKVGLFFSLPVLRYALPAVILLAVVAIGLIAFRQQRRLEYVAQNGSTTRPDENLNLDKYSQPATPQSQERSSQSGEDSKAGLISQKENETNKATTRVGAEYRSESGAKEDRLAKTAPAMAEPSYAPEPSAAAPAAKPRMDISQEEVAKERDTVQPGNVEGGRPNEAQPRAKDEAAADDLSAARVQNAPSDRRTAQGLMAAREAKRPNDKLRSEMNKQSETRTVAGRHFRRQGNAWVDTGYESSRATTNIVRGSEQYGTLVRDEPEIRSIAEQLAGEVIVVWKGRAYRIR